MSATLLLRLDGPLQAWGVASRYGRRDTLDHPSKSGVIGLCAAALGRRRDEPIDDLARLVHGVLVVDPGRVVEDYHTVSNAIRASRARRVDLHPAALVRRWTPAEIAREKLPSVGDNTGAAKATEVTRRLYLADALFVAGLEGPRGLLEEIRSSLRAPVFPICLGRASCLPGAPVGFDEREDGGLVEAPLAAALRGLVPEARAWLEARHGNARERARRLQGMRLIVECPPDEATIRIQDQPLPDSFASRRFATRYARSVDLGAGDA